MESPDKVEEGKQNPAMGKSGERMLTQLGWWRNSPYIQHRVLLKGDFALKGVVHS